jgi:hypothetical protein
LRLARAGEVRALARATRRLVANLREDMDEEERDLLRSDLLRDDAIVIDQSDG